MRFSWLLVLFSCLAVSQQDPQYTNYMYAVQVVNPAYAGSNETLSLGLLHRNQWAGFSGAPETTTLFGHSSLNTNMGLGLSVIADRLGPVKETNVYADVSYALRFKNNKTLAFGLKVGTTFHDIGTNNLVVFDPNDPFFTETVSTVSPNIGAGLFYYFENYYVGFSVPNLLESVHLDRDGNQLGTERQHFFFMGGYVFQLNEIIKLKPSFLVKSAFEASTSFDVNFNILLYDRLELGGSYRYDDSFSVLVNFAIQPNLRIGYAYDAVVSDIQPFAPSSHEFFILYEFGKSSKDQRIKSPRFF